MPSGFVFLHFITWCHLGLVDPGFPRGGGGGYLFAVVFLINRKAELVLHMYRDKIHNAAASAYFLELRTHFF